MPTVTTPTNLTESQLAEVAASYLLADPEVGADHEDAGTAAGHAMPAGAMHVGRRGCCRSGRRTPRGHRRRTSTGSRYSLVGLLIFLSFPLLHTEQRPQNAPLPRRTPNREKTQRRRRKRGGTRRYGIYQSALTGLALKMAAAVTGSDPRSHVAFGGTRRASALGCRHIYQLPTQIHAPDTRRRRRFTDVSGAAGEKSMIT